MSTRISLATCLVVVLSSGTAAQSQPVSAFRQGAATIKVPQPAADSAPRPRFSVYGGVATGDEDYDLGFAAGFSARWTMVDWPIRIRGDLHVQRNTISIDNAFGDVDGALLFIGAIGNAEYVFPGSSSLRPYVFGGIGFFYTRASIDVGEEFGGESDSEGDSELGLNVGGGLNLSSRFGVEARIIDIGGFTTIPIVAVLHF